MPEPNQSQSEPSEDYRRFEDFARKIIAVPKKELDERLEAEKKAKQKPAKADAK